VPRGLTALLLAIALASTAACGGDDDGDDKSRATSSVEDARGSTTTTAAAATPSTAATAPSTAAAVPDLAAVRVGLTAVASGLDSPVDLATRNGDDRFYVAEQDGRVRIIDGGEVLEQPVLGIDVSSANEQGLLGLAFSPDGSKLYVDYTDPDGNTNVDEYTMDGDIADAATRRRLLFVDDPYPNHNGGQIFFGPDGMLYITLGDGGSAGDPENRAQDLGQLFGKVMRIDPTPTADAPYTIPSDNPFVGRDDARPEVWMYGLRNPWRFSFDRATRDVWIGDVGQGEWEEINFADIRTAPGSNWGWSLREGAHEFKGAAPPGAREPIFELSHDNGNCSVTGGYVYRGERIPALRGAYVFADFCAAELLALAQRDGALVDQRSLGVRGNSITSFAEDTASELYVLMRTGFVYRIDPA
jgi:glucose/arabinose dehydrogenase